MKGIRLSTKICIVGAFSIGLVMALINAPSWSQLAGLVLDPLLYVTLGLIMLAFYGTSFDHPNHKLKLFDFFNIDVRFEHIARIVSFCFLGILTFSVNNKTILFSLFGLDVTVELLHLVFTGLGIGFGYLLLLFYYKTNRERLWSYVGVVVGVVGFLLGFLFNLYSTAWAEVIASIPLALFLYITIKK